jgi:hypothetical protein
MGIDNRLAKSTQPFSPGIAAWLSKQGVFPKEE